MAIKRRLAKGRKQLGSEEMQDLFYGPGSALINGCGYCGQLASSDRFEELPPAEQATVIEAMRDDWTRQRATILAAWDSRTPHECEMAARYDGNPNRPWAEIHFAAPAPARDEPGQGAST